MWHGVVMCRLKEVICFGEGAGANILARFAVRTFLLHVIHLVTSSVHA